jgi:predicted phosphoribosyltransferase
MKSPIAFDNRQHAGEQLAAALSHYAGHAETLVLALPRGGVPVGFAIAQHLGLPLDIILVRKLGLPQHEEYAMGAIASGGVRVLNPEAIEGFAVRPDVVEAVCARESAVIAERERLYRGNRPPLDLHGRTAILVDDGLATGSTMRVAAKVARRLGAARVVAAVPVAPAESCALLGDDVDEIVCLSQPPHFRAVSQWYRDFDQTSDEEVQHLLALAWRDSLPTPPRQPRGQRGQPP